MSNGKQAFDLSAAIDEYEAGRGKTKSGKTQPVSTGKLDLGAAIDEYERELSAPAKPKTQARNLTPTERQEFGQRRPPSPYDQPQSRFTFNRPAQARQVAPGDPADPLERSVQDMNRRGRLYREQEAKPLGRQLREQAYTYLAEGGGELAKMGSAAIRAIGGANVPGGEYALGRMDEFRARRDAEIEAENERYRPTVQQQIARGIISGAPVAAAGGLLTAATGGGLPAAMAVGGGMGAAGADWRDPKRAATQTALGAIAPVIGGKIGRTVGGRVAQRLASPAAQATARAGGELIGGGAGNVLATGGEQLAFEGTLNPRELIKAGAVGAALSTPGAIGTGGRPLPTAPRYRTRGGAIIAQPSTVAGRRLLGPGPAEDAPITNRLRTPEGAIYAGPSSLPSRRLLGPAPSAPDTQEIPRAVPTAPETQRTPIVGRELVRGQRAREAEPTAELPAVQAPAPQPRVPKATPENIEDLRARREELSRLAYDRRGDVTGDLRDELRELGSRIVEFENEQARIARGGRLEPAPPPGTRPERMTPPAEEREARRAALEPRTGPMPEVFTPGRKVTREAQVPRGLRVEESHISREDARQGYFEQFTDAELVDEIRRMEGVRNDAIRGRSKLTPAQLEANNFDLKVAVGMQKERRRLQQQIGVEAGERIAPRTPAAPAKVTLTDEGRRIQHSQFGQVTEAADQSGVRKGQLRVVDAEGKAHVIKNPRVAGNREAAFVKASTGPIPAEAMPEMQGRPAERPVPARGARSSYAIPDEAMPEMRERGKGQVMGGIFGGLQPLFGKARLPSRAEASETVGGVQTVAQLGNPRFVIRNVLQHVAYGKQERTATRLAAALDWAYSKATGKGRQIAAPRGSDLASYVRNWGSAVRAYKSGRPLPGGQTPIAHTANANAIDKGVQKLMTWMNEIPDAANWQTRFEDSLQSITRKNPRINAQDAIDQATMEANRASLRDPNFVSAGLQFLKNGLNKLSSPIFGTDKFGAGDFVLKYAQTPGALFKRGLERSPLGLFQVAKEAATPGPFRRRNTLLALSRVAEGAATGVGLGAGLAAAGVLVGPEETGKSGKAMEREEGVRGYSLNASALMRLLSGGKTDMEAGDTLYSIDWLQPWAMNLSAGAALWNLHRDGQLGPKSAARGAGEAVYDSLAKTLDIMGDQSVLKSLSRYMDKATGETFSDKFYNFAKAVGLDVPSSFVPSLARQARQVIDPFERDTRPEERGGVKGFAKEAAGRALQQIPGLSERFPKRPSLLTGEDRKTALGEMGVSSRIAAQFSPANVSTYAPRAVAREISRLNRAGEKVSVSFPQAKTDKETGKREPTSDLRGRERRFAETWSRMSQEMIADPSYKDADNATKAAAFAGLKRHLAGLGKEDFEEKGVDEIVGAAAEAVERRRAKEEQ